PQSGWPPCATCFADSRAGQAARLDDHDPKGREVSRRPQHHESARPRRYHRRQGDRVRGRGRRRGSRRVDHGRHDLSGGDVSRLDSDALRAAAMEVLDARPDDTGAADLTCAKGSVVVAADPAEFKKAFKRLKKIDGYRWIVINREDLFAANTLSIGSKAGIIDESGAV